MKRATLSPRAELPHVTECPAEFWSGWWHGMALGVVLTASLAVIARGWLL